MKPAGLAAVMAHLRDLCRMRGPASVFCDIGCGEARPVLAALEACPRIGGAIGFDVDETTLRVARNNLSRFSALSWNGNKYVRSTDHRVREVDPPACLLVKDLTHLADLGCTSHAYCFCNGMPPFVLAHLFRILAQSPALRYVVLVYKKMAGDLAYELVRGIEEVAGTFHLFVDPESNRSLLHMPGQTAHGACFHLSTAVRDLMRSAGADAPLLPRVFIDECFAHTAASTAAPAAA